MTLPQVTIKCQDGRRVAVRGPRIGGLHERTLLACDLLAPSKIQDIDKIFLGQVLAHEGRRLGTVNWHKFGTSSDGSQTGPDLNNVAELKALLASQQREKALLQASFRAAVLVSNHTKTPLNMGIKAWDIAASRHDLVKKICLKIDATKLIIQILGG